MIVAEAIVADAAARGEAKAYLRIETYGEDALIDRLIAAAIGHGEAFTGQVLLARTVRETVPAGAGWRRLTATPVGAIGAVEGLAPGGGSFALAAGAYGIDIDAAGDGWVRVIAPGEATRVTVRYTAGLAGGWSALPEPVRQGIIRLATHLYTHRDAADETAPPAAVAALWRPWRRMRLA